MHDESAEGADFFKCDFCASPWSEERPMIEGHKGSLICAPCLSIAYRTLAIDESGEAPGGWTCAMCLEERAQPGWRSPMREQAIVCLRCVKQAATQMEKDPDVAWTRPAGG
jgi:hypothetical protein